MLNAETFPPCIVLVSDKPASSFPLVFYFDGLGRNLSQWVGANLAHMIYEFKNGEMLFCVDPLEWEELGVIALEKIMDDPLFFEQIRVEVREACSQLVAIATKAKTYDYEKASNEELLQLYVHFGNRMARLTSAGLVFSLIEARNEFLTIMLKEVLSEKLLPEEVPEAFSLLTTPTEESFVKKERASLLRLGMLAEKELGEFRFWSPEELLERIEKHPKVKIAFDDHYGGFFWMSYNYEGPCFSKLEVVRTLLEHARAQESLENQLKSIPEKDQRIQEKQKELEKALGLDEKEKNAFSCARQMVFLKGYRKDMAVKAYCFMEKWLAETGKRFGLGVQEMRMLSPDETEAMLLKGTVPGNLSSRRVLYVLAFENGECELFVGEAAKGFSKKIVREEVPSFQKEITGSCACPGFAKGKVKIINTVEDLRKMEEGDVLVSMQTNPNLMPAIAKASAIVADTGGITSHAAIISRELQVPCVVGTKLASKWLKDGDEVEVDASKGIVRKLSSETK